MSKISIYQVFTRLFGNKNATPIYNGSLKENGSGKMSDFNDKALTAIKEIGITHIWYTGIIEHATCESYTDYNIKAQHPTVVKGRAGSPYAITDYFDVNPYLADDVSKRMKEFESLIERTHKNGLKAIIDFVPNHVARQYDSDVYPEKNFGKNDDKNAAFSPNNDFYYIPNEPMHIADGMGTDTGELVKNIYEEFPAKATGNDQFNAYPTVNDWYETVKLNYGVDYSNGGAKHFNSIPPLWDKMVGILEFWCGKKIDAIRCDMVEMVPVEFWKYAIVRIKENYPQVIFIAEVYNPAEYHNYLKRGGFDYLYDKVGLYDCLRDIICNNAPAYNISRCWENLEGIDAKMLRFLENHDEHRIAAKQFARNPYHALPAMFVSATLHTGPVMIYFGQEVGESAFGQAGYSGDDGKTTIFDFFNVPEHQKWMNNGKFDGADLSKNQTQLRDTYVKLLNFAIKSDAIGRGKFYDLMWANNFDGGPDSRFIYAYLRYCEGEKLLLVINFHKSEEQKFRLKIPEHALNILGLSLDLKISLLDIFSDLAINKASLVNASEMEFNLTLNPLQSCVFTMK
ncbi:MAG: alpha-amylase family protein [Salinivirgaceae bacterium]|jgi:glycosidase|nr:alpha-amylase family protein [Salinivirgaceae bacterium]